MYPSEYGEYGPSQEQALAGSAGSVGGSNLFGAILGAGASIYEGYQNRKQAKWNVKQQQQFALNQSKAQREWDLAMWHKANEYNSPREQMARLKGAGLNPNMIYGSGSATGNTSTATPSYSKAKTPNFLSIPAPAISKMSSALAAYQDFRMKESVIKGKDISNNIGSVEALWAGLNASKKYQISHRKSENLYAENKLKGALAKIAPQLAETQLQAKQASAKNLAESARGKNLENDLNQMLKPYGFTTKDHPIIRTILTVLQKENPDLNAVEAMMILPKMVQGIDASSRIMKP